MTNSSDLQEFIGEWFEPDDMIRIGLVKGKKRVYWTYTFDDVMDTSDANLRDISRHQGEAVNVFVQVHPVRDSDIDLWHKGGEDNTQLMRGVYLDLDIKPGSFQTQEEIVEFVHSLEVQPTIMVDSGTGGVHAYYAFEEDVDVTCKPIQGMFREYVKAKAYPRVIDNLKDIARELRLPGTLRFDSQGREKAVVSVLELGGDRVSYEELRELVKPYYEARRESLRSRQRYEDNLLDGMDEALEGLPGFMQRVMIEDWINAHVDWSEILQDWECTKTSPDGTRQWQRPGPNASSRSATTDWEEAPHTMSLFSSADETGLTELQDEEVKLTKFRVILKLHFEDEYEAMMHYYLDKIQTQRKA